MIVNQRGRQGKRRTEHTARSLQRKAGGLVVKRGASLLMQALKEIGRKELRPLTAAGAWSGPRLLVSVVLMLGYYRF